MTGNLSAPRPASAPVIYVVDDDDAVRTALSRLLTSAGHAVQSYASGKDFLAVLDTVEAGCVVLDMNMPDHDGLDVVSELVQRGVMLPVIILTGFGSIPLTVTAMRAGVHEFLTKPVAPEALLLAIERAMADDARHQPVRQARAALTARFQSLTPREREVFSLVVTGLMNKQIASRMGISEITAKVHRRSVMDKMQAHSAAELGRYAEQLNSDKPS